LAEQATEVCSLRVLLQVADNLICTPDIFALS
jgi:hypothetical protein